LEDCDMLLVVGTPAVRPEQVARLARAYYHADPQVIDEASERGEAELEERGEAVTRACAGPGSSSFSRAPRAPGCGNVKRAPERLDRCYQFCNIALLAFLITCLRSRTAKASSFWSAHRHRWTRPKLQHRRQMTCRSCQLCLRSVLKSSTGCSGTGLQAPGIVRSVPAAY
jgi:hypothetical protein